MSKIAVITFEEINTQSKVKLVHNLICDGKIKELWQKKKNYI